MNERDALIRAIKDEWHGVTDHSAARGMAESAADAVLASAAWRNRHREPSAEAIEAAAHVLFRFEYPHERIAFPNDWEADVFRRRARAALEGAESTRTTSTEESTT